MISYDSTWVSIENPWNSFDWGCKRVIKSWGFSNSFFWDKSSLGFYGGCFRTSKENNNKLRNLFWMLPNKFLSKLLQKFSLRVTHMILLWFFLEFPSELPSIILPSLFTGIPSAVFRYGIFRENPYAIYSFVNSFWDFSRCSFCYSQWRFFWDSSRIPVGVPFGIHPWIPLRFCWILPRIVFRISAGPTGSPPPWALSGNPFLRIP